MTIKILTNDVFVYNEWYVSVISCEVLWLSEFVIDIFIYIWWMYERDITTENDDDMKLICQVNLTILYVDGICIE